MALSTIRRAIRIGAVPHPDDPNFLQNTHKFLVNFSDEMNNFTVRETAVWSHGYALGAYMANVRKMSSASITSVSNFGAGSQTITVSTASGAVDNVPWSLMVGDYLNVEPSVPANQEYVRITTILGTSVTATFAKAHDGSGTPYRILVPIIAPAIDAWNTLVNDLMMSGRLGS